MPDEDNPHNTSVVSNYYVQQFKRFGARVVVLFDSRMTNWYKCNNAVNPWICKEAWPRRTKARSQNECFCSQNSKLKVTSSINSWETTERVEGTLNFEEIYWSESNLNWSWAWRRRPQFTLFSSGGVVREKVEPLISRRWKTPIRVGGRGRTNKNPVASFQVDARSSLSPEGCGLRVESFITRLKTTWHAWAWNMS